jgi:uncharacterized iron-regulated membrane protein
MITLEDAMQEASTRLAEHYASAQDINEGGCFDWATEVIALVDCKIVARTYLGGYHCFIEHRKKFYDAEVPQGIRRWQDLPYFRRCK